MVRPPRTCRRTRVAAALALAAAGLVAGPAAAAEPPTTTFVTADDSGDPTRKPSSRVYHPGNARFEVYGTAGLVEVRFEGYGLRFGAPQGQSLAPGAYEHAVGSTLPDPEHPTLRFDGAECGTADSRFVVHDIALGADGAVTRFLATYEYRCEWVVRAVTGQVGVDVPAGPLAVYGSAPRYPETYPGTTRDALVWLHNRGAGTVTVNGAALGGADPAAFALAGSTCRSLAPGALCAVRVRFRPPGGRAYAAALTLATSAGSRTVPLSGRGIPGSTALRLRSELGDPLGLGGPYDFVPATSWWETFAATGRTFHARVFGRADYGSVVVTPPDGGRFEPGTRHGAGRWTDVGDAGVLPTVAWRWCPDRTWSYTVHQAAYDAAGRLTRLALSFEVICAGSRGGLAGRLSWRASVPNPPPPAPPAVTNLRADARGAYARVAWDLPAGVSTVAVRGGRGAAVRRPGEGDQLFTGAASAFRVGPIGPSESYVVSVFGIGGDGHVSAVRTIRLRGTALMLGASATAVRYGDPVTLRMLLVDAATRARLANRTVVLSARVPGGTWSPLRALTTDRYGRASFRFAPRRSYEYRATFAGRGVYLGDASNAVTVTVEGGA